MSWKCNSKTIDETDIVYLCHNKICAKGKFCGLFIVLFDTAFKSPNGKVEYTIIENVQTLSSMKFQISQYKAQNYMILYFAYASYSFITNSFLRLM